MGRLQMNSVQVFPHDRKHEERRIPWLILSLSTLERIAEANQPYILEKLRLHPWSRDRREHHAAPDTRQDRASRPSRPYALRRKRGEIGEEHRQRTHAYC